MAERTRYKLERAKILKARKFLWSELSSKQKRRRNESRFVFNTTYHQVFSKLGTILSYIHLLLAPDRLY